MSTALPSFAVTASPSAVVDGIGVYHREDYNGWFETEYAQNTEPWAYSVRGGELNRHRYTIQQIKQYKPRPKAVLELGSSKGLMTGQLMPFCDSIASSDVSLTAMQACKQHCATLQQHHSCHMSYYVTTTPGLPFADGSFDVVTVCDGLIGWWFSEAAKKLALEDVYRVLQPGGIAVLTDFFTADGNLAKFAQHESIIRNSPLTIVSITHLYDRPWYLLESLVKKIRLQKPLRGLLSSVPVARVLNGIGSLGGKKLSNHMVIIAQKQ